MSLACFVSPGAATEPLIIGGPGRVPTPDVCPRPYAHAAREELTALERGESSRGSPEYFKGDVQRTLLNLTLAVDEHNPDLLSRTIDVMRKWQSDRNLDISIQQATLVLARLRHDVDAYSEARRNYAQSLAGMPRSDDQSDMERRRALVNALLTEAAGSNRGEARKLLRAALNEVDSALPLAKGRDVPQFAHDFERLRMSAATSIASLDDDVTSLSRLVDEHRTALDAQRPAEERLTQLSALVRVLNLYASKTRGSDGLQALDEAQRRVVEARELLPTSATNALRATSRSLHRFAKNWRTGWDAEDPCVGRATLDLLQVSATITAQSIRGDTRSADTSSLKAALPVLQRVQTAMSQQPDAHWIAEAELIAAQAYRLLAVTDPQVDARKEWISSAEASLNASAQHVETCFCVRVAEAIALERARLATAATMSGKQPRSSSKRTEAPFLNPPETNNPPRSLQFSDPPTKRRVPAETWLAGPS